MTFQNFELLPSLLGSDRKVGFGNQTKEYGKEYCINIKNTVILYYLLAFISILFISIKAHARVF